MTDPAGDQPPRDLSGQFEQRMEAFGREAGAAGQRLGREAQEAGQRLARDPELIAAGTWFGRFVGLVFIVLGLWLFGTVTLGLDLPPFDWNLVWPALLVVLGGLVLVSAATRRR